ncbi:MAG TPA: TlpA disulfide reductase family protein [Gaiellaceae bacterium]|nr:TlpA disulfide reductase family protein [Gaiellaceae bacterium]
MRPRVAVQAVAGAAVAALAVVLVWHVTHQPKSIAPQVARHEVVRAPGFTLARLNGAGSLSFSSLHGKAVVVNFWASDCAPCKQEMPRLVAFSHRWSSRGVVVVGVDVVDSKGPARAFIRRYGATYPTVFDPSGSTVDPWGVGQGTPQTFFVDRQGRIVDHVLGPVSSQALQTGARRALRS